MFCQGYVISILFNSKEKKITKPKNFQIELYIYCNRTKKIARFN